MLIYTPNAPSVSSNNLITSSRVDLTITPPGSNGGSAITSYKIYINGSYTGSFGYTGTTATYQATGLSASTQYTFTVTAVNEIGEGSPSAGSITTTMNAPNVTATAVSSSQVDLTISPPTNNIQRNPITSYKIYINDVYKESVTADSSYNATYQATSLSRNTLYSFTVSAVSIDGDGAKSTAATATTLATVPDEPVNITATLITGTEINITITPGSDGGSPITSYNVYINGSLSLPGGSTTTNSYKAIGLSPDTLYNFGVAAVNLFGPSNIKSFTATTIKAPGIPTFTTTVISDTEIDLTITPDLNGGSPTSYNVYINDSLAVPGGSTTTNSYKAIGLSANTSYSFAVSAVNTAGEGIKTAVVSSQTFANPAVYYYYSNTTITPPNNNKFDVLVIGGGGGGQGGGGPVSTIASYDVRGGGGGTSGGITYRTGLSIIPGRGNMAITIGAGGVGGARNTVQGQGFKIGYNGGQSAFSYNSTTVIAPGGIGCTNYNSDTLPPINTNIGAQPTYGTPRSTVTTGVSGEGITFNMLGVGTITYNGGSGGVYGMYGYDGQYGCGGGGGNGAMVLSYYGNYGKAAGYGGSGVVIVRFYN